MARVVLLRVELFFIDSSSGGGGGTLCKDYCYLISNVRHFLAWKNTFYKKVVLAISKFLIKMTQIVIMCFMMMEYHCEVLLLLMKNSYYAICQLMICQLVEILMKYLNKYNIGNQRWSNFYLHIFSGLISTIFFLSGGQISTAINKTPEKNALKAKLM